jgi:hypothetical protein
VGSEGEGSPAVFRDRVSRILVEDSPSPDGKPAYDEGRLFQAVSEENPISSAATRTLTVTSTGLLADEVAGAPADFEITIRNDAGAVIEIKRYPLSTFGMQVIDLTHLGARGALQVEFKVLDRGALVAGPNTPSPELIALTEPGRRSEAGTDPPPRNAMGDQYPTPTSAVLASVEV